MSAQPRRGRLVVVEGLDRSGKSSQCQLLVDGLNKAGTTARYVKFPGRDWLGAMTPSILMTLRQDYADRTDD